MGDIEKSIRDKVGKRLKEATNRWSPDSQPNLYELSNFLQKSGYRLVDALDEDDAIELIIEAIKPGYLHPEIIHNIAEGVFTTKVDGHGLVISSDLEVILEGYSTALGVLEHLDSLDLSKLEI